MTNVKWIIGALAVVLAVLIVLVLHLPKPEFPFNPFTQPEVPEYTFARPVSEEEAAARLALIAQAETWLGVKGGSSEHGQILSIYNNHQPLAQGYAVQSGDAWCATFVSTCAIQLELTDIIPTECGCQRQIGLWQDMGRWEEADDYIPLPGDIIYYSSKGAKDADNTGWSDHVGIVVGTWKDRIKVIEGNSNDRVEYRYISMTDPTVRGFAIPQYLSNN